MIKINNLSLHRLASKLKEKYLYYLYPEDKRFIKQCTYINSEILVLANEVVGRNILSNNYEKMDINYLLKKVSSNDIFFDVGANVGVFSLIIQKHEPTCKVYAFEPIQLNRSLFQASALLSNMNSMSINECCVGNKNGITTFSLSKDSAYSSMTNTGRSTEVKSFDIEIIKLDSYIEKNNINKIDILKIDVEGAEKMVLKGSIGILKDINKRPKIILIELYEENLKVFNTSINDIRKFLEDLGYHPFVVIDDNKLNYTEEHYSKYYNVFFEII